MTNEAERSLSMAVMAILVLSLECVIEGLVTQSELRGWIFHAGAAGCAVWALQSRERVARIVTMVAGLVAFVNDGLVVLEESVNLKHLLPSLVLFTVSVVGMYLLLFSSGGLTQSVRPTSTDPRSGRPPFPPPARPGSPIAPSHPRRNQERPFEAIRRPPPFSAGELIAIVGGLAVWYSFALASWYDVDRWFGLTSASVGFQDLRRAADGFDGLGPSSTGYLQGGYLLSYLAVFAQLGSSVLSRTRWSIDRIRPDLLVVLLSPVLAIWQSVVSMELRDADGGELLSQGPWIGVTGLAMLFVGSIVQRRLP